ncbi:MAG: serine/threonine-protein kinase [Myxococcota bacterium]
MSVGEVEFIRPHLNAVGVDDETVNAWIRQWAQSGSPSFIHYLGEADIVSMSDARQIAMVFKGYLSLDLSRLLASLRPVSSESASTDPTPDAVAEIEVPREPRFAAPTSMSLSAFVGSQGADPDEEIGPATPTLPATNPLAGAFTASSPSEHDSLEIPETEGESNRADALPAAPLLTPVTELAPRTDVSEPAGPVTQAQVEVGGVLGRYTLQEVLGEGSTSRIFRAFHHSLNVPVAIKVYHPSSRVSSPELESKFINEARMLARLDHPNIVRVLDVDVAERLPLIVFEFVGAMTLEELIQATGPLPAERVARVGIQVADALENAALQSVLHRDVKPANVLLKKDGTAKLADFGLATVSGQDEAAICGSPAYMAPEQILDPGAVDHRADMYGLGATLYHAASGHPPFVRSSPKETLRAQIHEVAIPLHKLQPSFDEALSSLIERLLSKKPGERFSTWTEVCAALRTCMSIVHEGATRSHPQRMSGGTSTGRLKRVMSSLLGGKGDAG